MKLTPDERTKRYLNANGWMADIVTRQTGPIKRDLFGIGDVIGIRPTIDLEVILVQATSRSNISARVKKIAESEHLPRLREMRVIVQIWGWDSRDEPKIVDLS